MAKRLVFPSGKAILFTAGEYSDFGTCGAVVTQKECDLLELAEAYCNERRGTGDDYIDGSGFVAWLVTNGWAFPAEIQEVWLGSYGRLDLD